MSKSKWKPMRAWVIATPEGKPQFTYAGLPELFRSFDHARSQNIDWRNGSRVVRIEIREVKPKKKSHE